VQPRLPHCGGDSLSVLSASGLVFLTLSVQKITLLNLQKALKLELAKALNESGLIERASVCSLSGLAAHT
jgi:hypothetical protein